MLRAPAHTWSRLARCRKLWSPRCYGVLASLHDPSFNTLIDPELHILLYPTFAAAALMLTLSETIKCLRICKSIEKTCQFAL